MSSIKDLEKVISNLKKMKTEKEEEIARIVATIDETNAEISRIKAENLHIKAGDKLIPKEKVGGRDFVVERVCSEEKINIKWFFHCVHRGTFSFDYLMENFDIAS